MPFSSPSLGTGYGGGSAALSPNIEQADSGSSAAPMANEPSSRRRDGWISPEASADTDDAEATFSEDMSPRAQEAPSA